MNRSLLILFFSAIFFGCQDRVQTNTEVGTWQSIGGGWILEITDTTYQFYDINRLYCQSFRSGSLEEIIKDLSIENDTLILQKGVAYYPFERIQELPELCNTPSELSDDVVFNFEVFAETVREHYAFMELNKLDWNEIYQQQKEKIISDPTTINLYHVIDETLTLMNDNHAYLEADSKTESLLEEEYGDREESAETEVLPEYGDFQIANMVCEHHLSEEMTRDNNLIRWGKIDESIGYIMIKAMWLHADLNIPKELVDEMGYVGAYVHTFHQMYEGDYIEKERRAVSKIMDSVVHDLSPMDGVVIDVRFNGGGQDAVSYEIISRFCAKNTVIGTEELFLRDRPSTVQSIFLAGTANACTKPIYVLTSRQSASAAESFTMAAKSLPHCTVVGTNTQGALSTALEKTLPNGWAFSISNVWFKDSDGHLYENVGIPADVVIDYPHERQDFFRSVANDLEADQQSILRIIQ